VNQGPRWLLLDIDHSWLPVCRSAVCAIILLVERLYVCNFFANKAETIHFSFAVITGAHRFLNALYILTFSVRMRGMTGNSLL
jgi:hypothetical protein